MGLAVPVQSFYDQMEYLKVNDFHVIGLSELINFIASGLTMPKKSIVITFDDGFKNIQTNALPILKEFGFPATLFVNLYFLERKLPKEFYWSDWETLNWEEIKQLQESDIHIGSHAFSHRKLTTVSDEDLQKEVIDSKAIIEQNIGDKIFSFSYPHGAFNTKVKNILQENNFRCACSSIEGMNNSSVDIFALKRTEITAFDNTITKFEKKILGCFDWVGRVSRWNAA